MRLALIANPGSGGGLDPASLVATLERHGAEVTAFTLEERDDVAGADPERVVVAGGDGSIGPAAELAGKLGVPLAVVPAGTANDFARAHELPTDHEEALELAALGTKTQTLDVGRIDGRPFVNVASAGLAPVAARHAHDHKPRLGPLAYLVGALRAGATAHPVTCDVKVDGRPLYAGEAWQVIVSVSGAFGGGSEVDSADPSDGRLHVTVVPGGRRAGLAWRAFGLRIGRIEEQTGVCDAHGREVELGLAPDEELNLDGELCGPGRLTVEPAAFSLVVG
jgi:diacylglycerol kinase family enzyme